MRTQSEVWKDRRKTRNVRIAQCVQFEHHATMLYALGQTIKSYRTVSIGWLEPQFAVAMYYLTCKRNNGNLSTQWRSGNRIEALEILAYSGSVSQKQANKLSVGLYLAARKINESTVEKVAYIHIETLLSIKHRNGQMTQSYDTELDMGRINPRVGLSCASVSRPWRDEAHYHINVIYRDFIA